MESVLPYKVAWMDSGDSNRLYSNFFSTEQAAKDYGLQLHGQDKDYLIFKKEKEQEGYYEWSVVPDRQTWKFRLGLFMTSLKFIIPVVLALLVFFLLKKNNGLPRVIG